MRFEIDKMDGDLYIDAIITEDEINDILEGQMKHDNFFLLNRRVSISVRIERDDDDWT